MNVDDLMRKAFAPARDPRSTEYKAGVRALLALRINGVKLVQPYEMGTVQADAFYAGIDEGHHIWRALREMERCARASS
ncbi:hypothetical protein EOS_32950 [Caballeronia mineralivorans PML1(12)]|uniref:Uncharacterized protein n=1 Tax=Caballeronia mineralivorans PML1(12) TaxID=908627 RepID=A0A0J1CN32_9BURK|nr:hypothetical protein [Caballeronia mineralivorans]KLU21954.1 hypothetical protein EOS_32950 [Caballeronia mineralivorans PML1(12)]